MNTSDKSYDMVNIELAKRFKNGDESALNELCRVNYKLIYTFSKSFILTYPWLKEDILGEARVGLVKACINYDYRKNLSFSTLAQPVIRNTIISFLRAENLIGEKVNNNFYSCLSLDKFLDVDNEETHIDFLIDEYDLESNIEEKHSSDYLLQFISERLKPNEMDMFLSLEGVTDYSISKTEYANKLGISKSYLNNLYRELRLQVQFILVREENLKKQYNFPDKWQINKTRQIEKALINIKNRNSQTS